jgi:hypothetical protein
MAHTARILVAGIVIAGTLVSAKHSEAAKPQVDATAARPVVVAARAGVRTESPTLAKLIGLATQHSATFRALIDTIEASDGIVYVNEGECARGVRACLLHMVTVAGPWRRLWVHVDTQRADWDLMGSIGHELHHSIEVLSDRRVTSNLAVVQFFRTEGKVTNGTFETGAAINAGFAVRAEVREALRTEPYKVGRGR